MKNYYVYVHKDINTDEIFYVGKGSGLRVLNISEWGMRSKPHMMRILGSKGFKFDILMSNLNEDEAFELEDFIIEEWYRYPLINKEHNGGAMFAANKASREKHAVPIDYIGLWRNKDYTNSLTDEEFKEFNIKLKKHLNYEKTDLSPL